MLRVLCSVCALLLLAAAPPRVGNAIHVGEDITVAGPRQVRNAICFFCSMRIDGAARSNLVVAAGNLYLNGPVHRDIVVLGGNVTMTGKATVEGSLVVFGGHLYRDPAATIGRGRVVIRPIVFLPILLILAAILAGLIFLLRMLSPAERSGFPPLSRY